MSDERLENLVQISIVRDMADKIGKGVTLIETIDSQKFYSEISFYVISFYVCKPLHMKFNLSIEDFKICQTWSSIMSANSRKMLHRFLT